MQLVFDNVSIKVNFVILHCTVNFLKLKNVVLKSWLIFNDLGYYLLSIRIPLNK